MSCMASDSHRCSSRLPLGDGHMIGTSTAARNASQNLLIVARAAERPPLP